MLLKKILLFFFLTIFLIGRCTKESNPFLNESKAGVVITKKSFGNSDTAMIFSSESLSLIVFIKEKVREFSISTPKNRFWSDTTIYSDLFNPEMQSWEYFSNRSFSSNIKILYLHP